jgi:FkbM family methyltransferase
MTSASWLFYNMNRLVVGAIKRMPIGSLFFFRAYNYTLKRISTEYTTMTVFGARMKCRIDDLVPRMIFYFGFWEPNNTAVISDMLKPGDVFLDVGANIGYYTLLGSSCVGANGQVISVEAAPDIFNLLKENVQMNSCRNVRLVNLAAAENPGTIEVFGGSRWNRGATTTVPSNYATVEAVVQSAPIDEVLTESERSRLALIKIDIEGGELGVLRRLLKTLDWYSHRLSVLAEMGTVSGGSRNELFDEMLRSGFRAYAIENEYDIGWYLRWRRPTPPQPITRLPDVQCDVLFVSAHRE